jgi:arylsulfatase
MEKPDKAMRPFIRTAWLVSLAVILGLSGVWLTMRSREPVNVILITVDTLRADHLGAYGYPRDTSPNLDALARESLLFRNAYSQSSETNPPLSSLMTSHYPHETKVFRNFHQLQPGALTLAEVLKAEGYRTGAVVSNFSLRRGAGFAQGFDTYDDQMDDWGDRTWEGYERVAPKTTAAAVTWLEQHSKERFFLWVHYMDPHGPYTPPVPYNTMFVESTIGEERILPFLEKATGSGGIPPYVRSDDHREAQYYIDQYDGEIRFFDYWLGELLKTIRALGLLEKSLIILTADHGEGMGEHDYYFTHPEFLYDGLIHVPLVVRFPGASPRTGSLEHAVALVDVFATILDSVSVSKPMNGKGLNLLDSRPRGIFAETHYNGSKFALTLSGLKAVVDQTDFALYDLERDPGEMTNVLADQNAEYLLSGRDLRERLEAVIEQDALSLGAPIECGLNAEIKRKLEALGYVQ